MLSTRQPTTKPVDHEDDEDPGVVDDVGEGPPGQDGRARHRQRAEPIDDPLVDVVGHPDRRRRGGEDDRLGEDPGHQERRVVAAAGDVDRAAEHEDEEQHEHDRLEDGEDRQLRDPRDPLEVAPADQEAVRDRLADAAARGSAWPGRSCGPPEGLRLFGQLLRARVAGQGQEDVVEGRPAQGDVVDVRCPPRPDRGRSGRDVWAPPWAGTVSLRVCSSRVGSSTQVTGQDLARLRRSRSGRGRRPRSARRRPAT